MFSFPDTHAECARALYYKIQGYKTKDETSNIISIDNDNIHLNFNLADDHSRDLLVELSEVTLPELYTLKIENFYESDEDLEKFMTKSISSV